MHLFSIFPFPRIREGDKSIQRKNVKLNTANKFVENLTNFQYLGKMQTNQNCVYEGNKVRLNSGNALLFFGPKYFVSSFTYKHKDQK